MQFLHVLQGAGVSFCLLFAVFFLMEKAFPAHANQAVFRPAWLVDCCYFAGQYFLWGSMMLWLLNICNHWLGGIMPATFRQKVASQPWWLQAVEVVITSDLLIYWAHRLQHNVGFLWRFHKVHHSVQQLDWLAAHREHPLDTIYTVGLINLPALIAGFPLETIGGLIAFRGVWAIYIHSNVHLNLGPLKVLVGSPELHHWHHCLERDAGNYANISPLMDIVFGTYTSPGKMPDAYGIREFLPRSYAGQMLYPMLPQGLAKRIWKQDGDINT